MWIGTLADESAHHSQQPHHDYKSNVGKASWMGDWWISPISHNMSPHFTSFITLLSGNIVPSYFKTPTARFGAGSATGFLPACSTSQKLGTVLETVQFQTKVLRNQKITRNQGFPALPSAGFAASLALTWSRWKSINDLDEQKTDDWSRPHGHLLVVFALLLLWLSSWAITSDWNIPIMSYQVVV